MLNTDILTEHPEIARPKQRMEPVTDDPPPFSSSEVQELKLAARGIIRQQRARAPNLMDSIIISRDSGVPRNIIDLLVELPRVTSTQANQLLEGEEITLDLPTGTAEIAEFKYSLYRRDPSKGNVVVDFVAAPTNDTSLDSLELVLSWISPLVFLFYTYSGGMNNLFPLIYNYDSDNNTLPRPALPKGIRDNEAVWMTALSDGTHRIWKIAYVRHVRAFISNGYMVSIVLVAPTWRDQYLLTMLTRTSFYVDTMQQREIDARYAASFARPPVFMPRIMIPHTLGDLAGGVLGHPSLSFMLLYHTVPATVIPIGLRRDWLNVCSRVKTVVVRLFNDTENLHYNTTIQVGYTTTSISSTSILSYAPTFEEVQQQDISVVKMPARNPSVATVGGGGGGSGGSGRREQNVSANEIHIYMNHNIVETVLVGDMVRYGLGEVPTSYVRPETRNKVGLSRIIVYLARDTKHTIEIPAATATAAGSANQGNYAAFLSSLRLAASNKMRRYVFASNVTTVSKWKKLMQEPKLMSKLCIYKELAPHYVIDNQRIITLRYVFLVDMEQSTGSGGGGGATDAVIYPQQFQTDKYTTAIIANSVPQTLRESFMAIGNSRLRKSRTARVVAHLLPSPTVRSYLQLYSNGTTNSSRSIGPIPLNTANWELQRIQERFIHTYANDYRIVEKEALRSLLLHYEYPDVDMIQTDDDWKKQDIGETPLAKGIRGTIAYKPQSNLVGPNDFLSGDTLYYESSSTQKGRLEARKRNIVSRDWQRDPFYNQYKYVHLGVHITGLHPDPSITIDTAHIAMLASDPYGILKSHGIDVVRVMVYVNFKVIQQQLPKITKQYINSAPFVRDFVLVPSTEASAEGEIVALPMPYDFFDADIAPGTFPMNLFESRTGVTAPNTLLNRELQ